MVVATRVRVPLDNDVKIILRVRNKGACSTFKGMQYTGYGNQTEELPMRSNYGKEARNILNERALNEIRDWCVSARDSLDQYSRNNDDDIADAGNRASVNDKLLAQLRAHGNEMDSDRAKFAALANAIEALWTE